MRAAAAHAAPNPEVSDARDIARRALRLSACPQRSIADTSSGGMSRLTVDSPNALGLATSAGMSDAGLRTVSPSPHDLASLATSLPRPSSTSTLSALSPTTSSRPCQAGPAQ